jgi:hypothetical protein
MHAGARSNVGHALTVDRHAAVTGQLNTRRERPAMHIVVLEFTADGPELEHSEIDRMIDELEREFVCRENNTRPAHAAGS